MRLFDTMSRELRELRPMDGQKFRFYCCGPTIYGPAHIGNFRTFVMQDVLRRTLETAGMDTLHVRNITDVDDKTIRDSQKAGLPLREFTARWKEKFERDCGLLNCLPPHVEPSAVEHIPQQIAMIRELMEKDHAYMAGDRSVYFRISSFPEYGRLSRLEARELELGKTQNQRAAADEYEKDNVADFVLWKAHREEDGDNRWDSPWGPGRPGWHLECSAMIREYLGDDFDLHSGGVDLIFPHHENEIAQSMCAHPGHFAAHWFHISHLLVDGRKMSKSLGNLYTLDDLAERGHTPMETRYVLLGGHYRKQLNFTLDSLHGAREALEKLGKGLAKLEAQAEGAADRGQADRGPFQAAWEALNDDLNTPGALGGLFTGLRASSQFHGAEAAAAAANMRQLLFALGLEMPKRQEETSIPDEIHHLAEERWAARQRKDWAASDTMREQLKKAGWQVKDARDGYKLIKI